MGRRVPVFSPPSFPKCIAWRPGYFPRTPDCGPGAESCAPWSGPLDGLGRPDRSGRGSLFPPLPPGLPLGLGTALQWAVLIAPFFMWGTSMVPGPPRDPHQSAPRGCINGIEPHPETSFPNGRYFFLLLEISRGLRNTVPQYVLIPLPSSPLFASPLFLLLSSIQVHCSLCSHFRNPPLFLRGPGCGHEGDPRPHGRPLHRRRPLRPRGCRCPPRNKNNEESETVNSAFSIFLGSTRTRTYGTCTSEAPPRQPHWPCAPCYTLCCCC